MTTFSRISAATALAALVVLTACSGGDDDSVNAAAQATSTSVVATVAGSAPPTTTTASPTTAAPATTTTAAATRKVSANNASIAELTAAFDAAGISNGARWAREVDEYRPYPNDPNLPKLRQELAKYNPGPGVVDAIVATLSLP